MSLPVEGCPSPLPLQGDRGDQALDLGGLAVGLAILALEATPVGVDVLAHIVILGQVEQLPDLGCPLGSPHAGLVIISQSRQLSWACTPPDHMGGLPDCVSTLLAKLLKLDMNSPLLCCVTWRCDMLGVNRALLVHVALTAI